MREHLLPFFASPWLLFLKSACPVRGRRPRSGSDTTSLSRRRDAKRRPAAGAAGSRVPRARVDLEIDEDEAEADDRHRAVGGQNRPPASVIEEASN